MALWLLKCQLQLTVRPGLWETVLAAPAALRRSNKGFSTVAGQSWGVIAVLVDSWECQIGGLWLCPKGFSIDVKGPITHRPDPPFLESQFYFVTFRPQNIPLVFRHFYCFWTPHFGMVAAAASAAAAASDELER
jgi:hypothetical protein